MECAGDMERIDIRSEDGRLLAAHWVRASATTLAVATVVIHSATGVPRRYYAAFAQHLGERGLDVLLWDARGIGDSATLPVSSDPATMRDWGQRDQQAVLQHVRTRHPPRPLSHHRPQLGRSSGGAGPSDGRRRCADPHCLRYLRLARLPSHAVAALVGCLVGGNAFAARAVRPSAGLGRRGPCAAARRGGRVAPLEPDARLPVWRPHARHTRLCGIRRTFAGSVDVRRPRLLATGRGARLAATLRWCTHRAS